MYLKNDRIVATIKGITFRSFRSGTQGQFVLDPTALTGWDDGTNVRRDATMHPVSSGDFKEPYTFSARLISLSGTAIAPNRQELQILRDSLTGVLMSGEYAELRIETSASVRFSTVGLENKVEWVQQLDNVASFRIEFYSPDPHIYGHERTINLNATTDAGGGLAYPLSYPLNYNVQNAASADMSVTNRGNANAWPTFKVTGDFYSGFTITDGTDKKITFTGAVSMASPVLIVTATGSVYQNGIDKSTLLTDRQWFPIPPKVTLSPRFIPIQNASGWCDIMVRDTYI